MVQFNYKWLGEWLSSNKHSAEFLAEQLNFQGFETELLSSTISESIVVGFVKSCSPHPHADKLNVCEVDVGQGANLSIVCGCPSVQQGIKVCCALVGAQVNGISIVARDLRGVSSQGMLCSLSELGLSAKAKGIWHLSEDAVIGMPLLEWLRLAPHTFAVDVTPNRGDAMSVRGVARELAFAAGCTATEPWSANESLLDSLAKLSCDLVIDLEHCTALHMVKLTDISNLPIPNWMTCRLLEAGIAQHNTVVDVLNYVMLETGQPMHAYDAACTDDSFAVGFVDNKTNLSLLNGDKVALDTQTLVVKNAGRPVCIAGYMGDASTQVNASTTSVYLEAAVFNPVSIAHSCRKYPFHTQSGARFERGIDANYTKHALLRAVELIVQITGAKPIAYASTSTVEAVKEAQDIVMSHDYFIKMLGYVPDAQRAKTCLEKLGFSVVISQQQWLLRPPSWRNEVQLPCHILAECVRLMRLLDNVDTPTGMNMQIGERISAFDQKHSITDKLSDILVSMGWFETFSYSFSADQESEHFLPSGSQALALKNPLMQSMSMLRTSLWSGLLSQLKANMQIQQQDVKLFEIGSSYFLEDKDSVAQPSVLAMAMTGRAMPESWRNDDKRLDFYYAKSYVYHLFSSVLAVQDLRWQTESVQGLHPHQSGSFYYDDQLVAKLGVIHPKLAKFYGVAEDTCLMQITINALEDIAFVKQKVKVAVVYPSMRRDLSIIVPDSVDFASVEKKVQQSLTNYLKDFILFDIYSGSQVPIGYTSLSVGFVFQHDERSLTDEDVQPMMDVLIKELGNIGVSIRGG